MQKSLRWGLVAALIGLGIWSWRVFFPSPEQAIRSQLRKLAETASFQPKDGTVPRGLKAARLLDFFTPDVVINLNTPGYEVATWTGRDELREKELFAMQRLRGLKIELLDVNVHIGPGRKTAVANLTGKATISGQSDLYVQEFNFLLRKVGRKWLIYRVDTVKTLSQGHASPLPRAG